MIISGKKILDDQYLLNGEKQNLSNATYNLTIGKILYKKSELSSIYLEPGEVACVVSKEIFRGRNTNTTALVNLKSNLTKQGILALDTGYVDPTYEGPIGTILVNFSKNSVPINSGETFFRVMFFKHDDIDDDLLYKPHPFYNSDDIEKSTLDYVNAQKRYLATNFTDHFLNTESLKEEIKNRVSEKIQPSIYSEALTKFYRYNKITFGLGAIGLILLLILFVFGYISFTSVITQKLIEPDTINSKIFFETLISELEKSDSFRANNSEIEITETPKPITQQIPTE